MMDKFSNQVRTFLQSHGIDPLHAVTVGCFLLVLMQWNDIRESDKTPSFQKQWIVATVVCTVLFTSISVLRIVGVIDF
jgi:hypothetical protein